MKKILVANRGEIAIRIFRAATELGISTVAIYAQEDEYSVHRFKADEAYLVGSGKRPIDAYLGIDEIIQVAKESGSDAIHPGYGLLSENIDLAIACKENGIKFIGPSIEHLDIFGDKIKAKKAAMEAGLKSIPSTESSVSGIEEVLDFASHSGYPIMIKAALGGGGRGMRIARDEAEARDGYTRAKSEALTAFGSDEIYVEKYIQDPKHIEVQIIGDELGNIVHLFERDCSVQRRHQKVIEVAPSLHLPEGLREEICNSAVRLMKHVGYENAGTVEFLVEGSDFYFIEVNPRVQVEHTITEMLTSIDIVTTQILVAQGLHLHDEIHLPRQESIQRNGVAIQCRITTEDAENGFTPDTGKIDTYRSPGGYGVRLDVGNAYAGYVVTPFFDSLLVKVCTHSRDFNGAVETMKRALKEFRIRGVKTNIPFMQNVINHPEFLSGDAKTTFIDNTPELFVFKGVRDRGNKTMRYIGNITVNGFPGIEKQKKKLFTSPYIPTDIDETPTSISPKNILDTKGPEAVSDWVQKQNHVLLTDTTYRDAHQSLLATRIRTREFEQIASMTEKALPHLFSSEMWGGATFDVSYRFLNEDPWERLRKIRKLMPNTLLQMLFRGSNAVGYSNYPDNVIQEFIKETAKNGMDVFRLFDSLNWVPQLTTSIQSVRDAGKIAEVAMCYTGDINDSNRNKYTLDYYKDLAKELVASGAHILAVKDMAGLLKPQACYRLISELKDTVDVPIHLHTHDTSGNGIITYSAAVKAGVDIVDVAIGALSSGTSQPSMSSLYYALVDSEREPAINIENVEKINQYWASVRKYYEPFEKGLSTPQTEVYLHEMPGGQMTNLLEQAKAVGLEDKWDEIKHMYHQVNLMFGDIVKVTPSSKVVGDMSLFMVQNQLTQEDIYDTERSFDFPDSVLSFFKGELGQPVGGFPEKLQKIVLKGQTPLTDRPGLNVPPVNFDEVKRELQELTHIELTMCDVLGYLMYPKIFLD
ncbi:MAG: pyruvate carboxylase, partial [Streptococcaceae bacterium]|nr:pyruvate carboxylase [Streptococcaceae bacterium]